MSIDIVQNSLKSLFEDSEKVMIDLGFNLTKEIFDFKKVPTSIFHKSFYFDINNETGNDMTMCNHRQYVTNTFELWIAWKIIETNKSGSKKDFLIELEKVKMNLLYYAHNRGGFYIKGHNGFIYTENKIKIMNIYYVCNMNFEIRRVINRRQ